MLRFSLRRALFGCMDTHRAQPDQEPAGARGTTGAGKAERLTFTVDEVAIALGISRSSAYECAKRGEIPTVRLGRRIVVPRRAVLELLGETDTAA